MSSFHVQSNATSLGESPKQTTPPPSPPVTALVAATTPQDPGAPPHAGGPLVLPTPCGAAVADFHPRNVYVAGLPATHKEPELQALFSRFGPIESARMMRNTVQGNQDQQVAFVMFVQPNSATACVQAMNNARVEGNKLTVRHARVSAPPGKTRKSDRIGGADGLQPKKATVNPQLQYVATATPAVLPAAQPFFAPQPMALPVGAAPLGMPILQPVLPPTFPAMQGQQVGPFVPNKPAGFNPNNSTAFGLPPQGPFLVTGPMPPAPAAEGLLPGNWVAGCPPATVNPMMAVNMNSSLTTIPAANSSLSSDVAGLSTTTTAAMVDSSIHSSGSPKATAAFAPVEKPFHSAQGPSGPLLDSSPFTAPGSLRIA